MEKDKKGRVKAGKKRELANVKNTLKKVGKQAVPSTLKLAATLPEHGKGKPNKRKELVDDVSTTPGSPAIAKFYAPDQQTVCARVPSRLHSHIKKQ